MTEESAVEVLGRFDAAQEDQARKVFDQVEASAVLDFSRLEYISSSGLGVILFTQKRLMQAGHALTIANPNAHILEILYLAGFGQIFEIRSSDSTPGTVSR